MLNQWWQGEQLIENDVELICIRDYTYSLTGVCSPVDELLDIIIHVSESTFLVSMLHSFLFLKISRLACFVQYAA